MNALKPAASPQVRLVPLTSATPSKPRFQNIMPRGRSAGASAPHAAATRPSSRQSEPLEVDAWSEVNLAAPVFLPPFAGTVLGQVGLRQYQTPSRLRTMSIKLEPVSEFLCAWIIRVRLDHDRLFSSLLWSPGARGVREWGS